jgi:hypothetical protein
MSSGAECERISRAGRPRVRTGQRRAAIGRIVAICAKLEPMGRAGEKPRKPKRRLAKVPKYEEPNTFPAPGLTGSSGEVFGSRYGHSADHHHGQEEPGRFGSFILRLLGKKPNQ